MEGSYPDWTSLPAEILSKIFHFAIRDGPWSDPRNAQCVSFQVALVCKAWRNPAQSILYSHVTIYTILQIEKFRDIIECNNDIGIMVKVLDLQLYDTSESHKPELLDIIANLLSNCLPNLVSLYQRICHSYVPTLNALLDYKLKYLRSIQNPCSGDYGDETVHYASCAFLMRDRLQEVYIDDFSYLEGGNINELAITKFQQLYDNLHQFNNLTTIKITRKTNDILQLLEYIVESCTSLKDMDVTVIYEEDHVEHKDNIDFDTTTHYIPRVNIKTLTIHVNKPQINVSKIFLYIMKKFPNLEELYLRTIKDNLQVAPYAILQLLKHSAKIKKFSLPNLTMNQDDIYEFIENVWNTTSKPGVVNVRLLCSNEYSERAESTSITIDKNSDKGAEINFDCYLKFHFTPPHMDFVEKIGNSIVTLTFEFGGNTSGGDSSENFLIHIFMHCPNLRNLHIDKCKLHKFTQSNFDKTNTYSLDKLTLKDCELDAGVLEQLSTVLSEVKQLHLLYTDYSNGYDDNGRHIFYVNMPQTKIQLFTYCSILGYPTYIKLFIVNDKKYYYYQPVSTDTDSIYSWERETMISEQIDKGIYDEAAVSKYELFDCCFQTKPEIAFEYCSRYEIMNGFQFH